ncbi:hypothetical protein ACFYYM_25195 [Streptomyces erythrochromogenes]|uniref:hypothetical protein n=1 Tax=Streptomyces erythrochromogenes TaxID=285574 RepID=UPI003685972A
MDLVVEATIDRAVIISKLEARVESRDAPPPDLYFGEVELPEAMEPDDLRRFRVNLDDPEPTARPADNGVPDFPYTVSHLDPERFILMVTADTPGDYTWSVAVHWLCKGQSGVVIADHEGPPARFVVLPPPPWATRTGGDE